MNWNWCRGGVLPPPLGDLDISGRRDPASTI